MTGAELAVEGPGAVDILCAISRDTSHIASVRDKDGNGCVAWTVVQCQLLFCCPQNTLA